MPAVAPYLALSDGLPNGLALLVDKTVVLSLSIGMAALGVVSLLALPFLLARIPADYFTRPPTLVRRGSVHWLGRVLKNVLGWLLLLFGIAMLVLPGQGLLTIVAAIFLLDFRGKRRIELWLVQRPHVLLALNALRRRVNRPPLQLPAPVHDSSEVRRSDHR